MEEKYKLAEQQARNAIKKAWGFEGEDWHDPDLLESVAKALQSANGWKDAITDAAVVNWTYKKEHEENPRAAVNALLCQAAAIAVDPSVSEEAAKLVKEAEERGRLAGLNEAIAIVQKTTINITGYDYPNKHVFLLENLNRVRDQIVADIESLKSAK